MIVAIVDYGSGNLRSAAKAFERAAVENDVHAEIRVTNRANVLAAADYIVLPGVGAFADCRRGLGAVSGLEAALQEAVIVRGRPLDQGCARRQPVMKVAIVDYGSGNLRSAAKAFERMAAEEGIAARVEVTDEPETVALADRVVLPGVGAFADCRRGLAAVPGLEAALREAVIARARPFLGICVGMQLMAERGREFETTEGLGWIGGEVIAIEPRDPDLKIPHMGWNEIVSRAAHPLLAGLAVGAHAYFVHSYHYRLADPAHLLADTDYGGHLAAVIGRDNLAGTQFHPEKSQEAGLRLIGNFLRWRP